MSVVAAIASPCAGARVAEALPLPIELDASWWYDIRQATAAGGDVASVADYMGGAPLANAATRPAYTADYGDGVPAADFVAGSSEWLYRDGQGLDFWQDFTIYFLALRTAGSYAWACGNTGNGYVARLAISNVNATIQLFDGVTAPEATANGSHNVWRIYQFARTGSTLECAVGGATPVTVASPANARTLDRLVVGASYQGAPSGYGTFAFRAMLGFQTYHPVGTTRADVRAFLRTDPTYGFPNVVP